MWLYFNALFWPSTWWWEFGGAFIDSLILTIVIGLLAGFFFTSIIGQILLAFVVFMVNPPEELLLTADAYCDIFTPNARPMGPCLEPIVIFILHVLPNCILEVNTVSLRLQYVLQQIKCQMIVDQTVMITNLLIDDESNSITLPTIPPTPAQTTWTLLIYLTSPTTGCRGGETVFYPEHLQRAVAAKKPSPKNNMFVEPIVVSLETGMALLHRHGNQCMLHEGREVLDGEKWVIRSDLCVRRNSTRELGASF